MEQLTSTIDNKHSGLDFLWLEITNRCNLQCLHCYAESGPYEPLSHGLRHSDWLRLLQEASELECKEVQFIGGEPLLYPRLRDLIRFAREHGYEFVEVFTNGTRLSQDNISFFREHGVQLAFSYYSVEAGVHDKVTRVKSSHLKTRRALEKAHAAGIPVRVSVIETSENPDAYYEVESELRAMGIEDVGLDYARNVGRGAQSRKPELSDLCGNCWNRRLAINSKGEVAGCIMSHDWNLGLASQGLRPILDGPLLRDFRNTIREMEGGVHAECEPSDYCNPHGFCAPRRARPCTPHCGPGMYCRPKTCGPDRCTPGNK